MRPHNEDDLRRDLAWLEVLEFEGITQAELAQRAGLSESQMSRRLARARRYRQEKERAARRDRTPDAWPEELPYVPLQSDNGNGQHFYDLDSDQCSIDQGRARIGTHGGADTLNGNAHNRVPDQRLEGQTLHVHEVNGGSLHYNPELDPEPESIKGNVNDSDKAKGVTYVQR